MPRKPGEKTADRKRRRERARTARAQRVEESATGGPLADRAGMILIRRAIAQGWNVPPHLKAALPAVVQTLAETADCPKDRLRAVELLIQMDRANTDALAIADKCERLDGGGATERLELAPITLRPGGGSGAA